MSVDSLFQILAAGGAIGNVGFSPFGLMAVSVLLYEGSSGYSALQIKQSLNLPWEILAVRIGVRDLNRYLKVNNIYIEFFEKCFLTGKKNVDDVISDVFQK